LNIKHLHKFAIFRIPAMVFLVSIRAAGTWGDLGGPGGTWGDLGGPEGGAVL
jgi:hypothetical protein